MVLSKPRDSFYHMTSTQTNLPLDTISPQVSPMSSFRLY